MNRFSSMVGFQAQFRQQVCESQNRRQGCRAMLQSRVARKVKRTDSTASFPRTGCSCSHEELSSCSEGQFRRTAASKVGSKNRFPSRFLNKVPKQGCEKSVPEQSPNEQVWSKVSKQVPQEQVPIQDYAKTNFNPPFLAIFQEVIRKCSKNRFPSKQVPKQGFDEQVSSNASKNSCPGKVPRTANNRILQSLKSCSSNGTEFEELILLQTLIRHSHMDRELDDSVTKESRRVQRRR